MLLLFCRSTLVCHNCDFVTSVINGDSMTKHLIERPSHVCRVLPEKGINIFEVKQQAWYVFCVEFFLNLFSFCNPAGEKGDAIR